MVCRPYSKWMTVRNDSRSQASVRTIDFPTSTRIRQGQSPRQTSKTSTQSFTSPNKCFTELVSVLTNSRDRCQGEKMQNAINAVDEEDSFVACVRAELQQACSKPRLIPVEQHFPKRSKTGIDCQEGGHSRRRNEAGASPEEVCPRCETSHGHWVVCKRRIQGLVAELTETNSERISVRVVHSEKSTDMMAVVVALRKERDMLLA